MPEHDAEPDPRAVVYAAARSALEGRGVRAEVLWRVTEAVNVPAVLAHGTDRAGRPEVDLGWSANGYRGAPRRWSEVVFASTEAEVRRRLLGLDPERPCALDKLSLHERAHVLCYDPARLEFVNDKQYAAAPGSSLKAALLLVLRASDRFTVFPA